MNNPFDQQKPIEGVKKILAVGSGKGGVGKSTVASNLALSLAASGLKVGLLDADIYGPSLPRIFGALNQRPEINDAGKILPLERYGVKLMSIGFLIDEKSAVIWRGPMLFKAMDQFFRDVAWGELDYLVIDLPPGTGDVQLSVVQKVPVDGAVMVTTPQNMALMDVKRSIEMFQRVNVPVLGVVENMAYFKPETGEGNFPLFPKGDLTGYLNAENLEMLGEIPFYPPLSKACEIGIPLTEQSSQKELPAMFRVIAGRIKEKLH